MSAYTANSIKIMSPEQAQDRFFYVNADHLAQKYPHVPKEFIERLMEACELSAFSLRDAVRKYLDGDDSVVVSSELVETHRDIARRDRMR